MHKDGEVQGSLINFSILWSAQRTVTQKRFWRKLPFLTTAYTSLPYSVQQHWCKSTGLSTQVSATEQNTASLVTHEPHTPSDEIPWGKVSSKTPPPPPHSLLRLWGQTAQHLTTGGRQIQEWPSQGNYTCNAWSTSACMQHPPQLIKPQLAAAALSCTPLNGTSAFAHCTPLNGTSAFAHCTPLNGTSAFAQRKQSACYKTGSRSAWSQRCSQHDHWPTSKKA